MRAVKCGLDATFRERPLEGQAKSETRPIASPRGLQIKEVYTPKRRPLFDFEPQKTQNEN